MKALLLRASCLVWAYAVLLLFYYLAPWYFNFMLLHVIFAQVLYIFTFVRGETFEFLCRYYERFFPFYVAIALLLLAVSAIYCGWLAFVVLGRSPLWAAVFGAIQLGVNLARFLFGLGGLRPQKPTQ